MLVAPVGQAVRLLAAGLAGRAEVALADSRRPAVDFAAEWPVARY